MQSKHILNGEWKNFPVINNTKKKRFKTFFLSADFIFYFVERKRNEVILASMFGRL